tara:strand:- start:9 stop:221 length:213 start_codon:yes stop_codon:yes gene_type:complete
MLVVIIYARDYESNAKSLKSAIMEEWSDVKVNLLGTLKTLYQIQLGKDIIYSDDATETNTNIINAIKERL